MIINIKQSRYRKTLDIFLTIFGWIFLTLFFINFISHLNSKLNLRFYLLSLSNANAILIFTFSAIVVSSTSLLWWSSYNKRKYGYLRRRKFPPRTNSEEIAEYFQISKIELRKIYDEKYIEIK